ncbi:hypothetical protein [Halostella salina]|uniref:hypothetical protein n=1 Tax=Halostella salina TaxID=1547897 RepID=UPI000EF788F9|nr:hypothetical protein [Halostella salina]
MTAVTLALWEVGMIVAVSVGLAATDAAALSRLLLAALAKRYGVRPQEIRAVDAATDGSDPDE